MGRREHGHYDDRRHERKHGHQHEHQHLSKHGHDAERLHQFEHQHLNLAARAHLEMLAERFVPDFEPAVQTEISSLDGKVEKLGGSACDLRSLLWSSIDNNDSQDLDQIEYVERQPNGDLRLMVGIADVDAFVAKGSAVDQHAYANTTSVYTGIVTYPMLPEKLSYDLSSLLPDQDRLAMVVDMIVGRNGKVRSSRAYRAIVRNHAKLAYGPVGQWLDEGGQPPAEIVRISGLSEQITLQNELRELLHDVRRHHGTLQLETIEARPVVLAGQVVDLELTETNPARSLIENFMIAANIAVSGFLEDKKIPSLRRVVRTPERWERIVDLARQLGSDLPAEPDAPALANFLLERKESDPEHFPDLSLAIVKLLGQGEYVLHVPGAPDQGHFALAVHDYTHATAPNRRYPDLVTQRLLKAAIGNSSLPYSKEELDAVARQCTEREDAARKVERTMRKVAAATLLSSRIGDLFDGIVTGVSEKGTFARLIKPPAEGRIVQGEHGLDVGDKVRLRLISTDPDQAFIDFARAR